MRTEDFKIPEEYLNKLIMDSKDGKNSHIGNLAIEIVKLYFLSMDPNTQFVLGKRNQPDITVKSKGNSCEYEVKGTQNSDIAFGQLKISSKYCYQKLVNGTEIIRVTNLRKVDMQIHFLKYGEDFIMKEEPRWAVFPIRKRGINPEMKIKEEVD